MREASEHRMATDTASYAFLYQLNADEGKSSVCLLFIMCKNLRKVTFKLGFYEHYPNSTPKQKEENKDLTREREGFFHRWVDDLDTSKEIPIVIAKALVEDLEDGLIKLVDYYNLKFRKN